MRRDWLACSSLALGLAYGVYAGLALLSFIFVLSVITETKGRKLEAMAAEIQLATRKQTSHSGWVVPAMSQQYREPRARRRLVGRVGHDIGVRRFG